MTGAVRNLKSEEELSKTLKTKHIVVLHFWASWCEPSKAMDSVFAQLAVDTPQAQFFRVEAEEQPEISEAYEVAAVPFFLLLKDGVVVDKLQGANAPELANKVAKWAGPNTSVTAAAPASVGLAAGPNVLEAVKKELVPGATPNAAAPSKSAANDSLPEVQKGELHKLVNSRPVMLFMKGTPEEPRCGFSRKVVDALEAVGAEFGSFDILSDETVRQSLKIYSNWPTFPQLYAKGELIGGCDIVLEMQQSGELKEILVEKGILAVVASPKAGTVHPSATGPVPHTEALARARSGSPKKEPAANGSTTEFGPAGNGLKARIQQLIHERPVMLFMKGSPRDPRCGFSRKVVQALGEESLDFGSFNILSDETVRQGLKELSNWPTYPQLYVKGEFIGGCDIILEMHQNGELKELLAEKGLLPKESLESRLKKLITSSPTMLFMKGTPEEPLCGFSTKVVNALRDVGVEFGSFNILSDEEIRQGLKTYSNWPTFPQLYHKGELLGGCDILLEMKASGELKSALSE